MRESATSKPPLGDPRFQRNEQHTFTDTRRFFFFLSQEVWLVVVLKTVHFTVHFFFLAKEISMYILTTAMMLPKPQVRNTTHTAQGRIMSRQSSEPLTGADVRFLPFRCPPLSLWVSGPKGQKKGGIWDRFLNGYILKG